MNWTTHKVARLRRMREVEGKSYRECAEPLGVSKNAVVMACHRNGIGGPKAGVPCRSDRPIKSALVELDRHVALFVYQTAKRTDRSQHEVVRDLVRSAALRELMDQSAWGRQ